MSAEDASAIVGGVSVPAESLRLTSETWQAAFRDESGTLFAAIVAVDVELEGSVLATPIRGRDAVLAAQHLSGSLYDRLVFTHESILRDRTFLEWEASAFGMEIQGLTALTIGPDGRVTRIALLHRPLRAMCRFAAALNDGLKLLDNGSSRSATSPGGPAASPSDVPGQRIA